MARRSHPSSRGRTISDVAELAGVSLSTVSRVMNGSTTVDAALAERVREAALSLNYTASPLARSLVLGKTQTVAVVVPDLANPVFQGMLRGLSSAAARQNYHVLVADSFENLEEERVLAVEARRRCDGIVLCAPRMPDEELTALLPELAPVVLINRDPSPAKASTVSADYHSGMQQLLEHLYGLGHRRIAYLPGSAAAQSNRKRLSAISEFADGHPDVMVTELQGGVGFEDGHAAADAVAASDDTAVLAFNDLVAMGLLSALSERGVRVPEDVSITGFDDIPFARYTTPPLTTASVPIEELGRQAWERLWALLNGQAPAYNLSFGPLVITRGSSGPAPAAA
ncbi:LacI family DNA-binding transcriptional regulator [Humibacter sp. RRB41]|uniref:LacI family DNA-binding transcriptional regulator n=1 Tax=Humibacter sp. RRB41 TaxID=2919946 RepID=UPI001FA9FFFE|nr:LacI family DNA-binding transcriptional regulator [Humibacter sp. RRB41]